MFFGGLWIVVDIIWWAVDDNCSFQVGCGWFFLFPVGLWIVAISWWALDGSCWLPGGL